MTPAARPPARRNGIAAVTTIGPPAELATLPGVQGTLALDLGEVAVHRPAAPTRPALRAVPAQRAEVESFAARFCAAVLEVLAGDRGPAQLLRCTTDEVYADLVRRSQALTQTAGSDQRVRRLRAQVQSVHVFCPHPDAAELCVHVRHGRRSRAIAGRLELREGRWTCVALQFG